MEVKSLALTTVGLSALDKRDVDPCNRAEGPMSSDRPSAEFKPSAHNQAPEVPMECSLGSVAAGESATPSKPLSATPMSHRETDQIKAVADPSVPTGTSDSAAAAQLALATASSAASAALPATQSPAPAVGESNHADPNTLSPSEANAQASSSLCDTSSVTLAGVSVPGAPPVAEASAAEFASGSGSEPKRKGRMTNQLSFILRVLCNKVYRHKQVWPFLLPIDAERLGIPDYHTIIHHPMDLSTVRKRLEENYYSSSSEALADIQLVFDNCRAYNPPSSDVSLMASAVEAVFNDKIQSMPFEEEDFVPPSGRNAKQYRLAEDKRRKAAVAAEKSAEKSVSRAAAGTAATAAGGATPNVVPAAKAGVQKGRASPTDGGLGRLALSANREELSTPDEQKARSLKLCNLATAPSASEVTVVERIAAAPTPVGSVACPATASSVPAPQAAAASPADPPLEKSPLQKAEPDTTTPVGKGARLATANRRGSTRSTRKPVRELPPAAPRRPLTDDMRLCLTVVQELMNRKHSSCNWPFLKPVDHVGLGLTDYLTVIEYPMDLSTIKSKIETYENAEQFESDIRLMFANCHRYNHEDSDVTRKCVQLEALYKKTMASMTEAARMLRLATDTKVKEAEEGNGQVKAHDSSDSDSDSSSDESSSSSSDVESDGGADGHDSDFEQRQSQVVKLQKELKAMVHKLHCLSKQPKRTKRKHGKATADQGSPLTIAKEAAAAATAASIATGMVPKRKKSGKAKDGEKHAPAAKKKKTTVAIPPSPAELPAAPVARPKESTSKKSKSKAKGKVASAAVAAAPLTKVAPPATDKAGKSKKTTKTKKTAKTASSRSSLASMKKEQMPPAVASGGGKRELDSIRLVPIELKRQLSQAINAMSAEQLPTIMKILKKYEPRYSELEGTDVEVDFEDLQDETVIALNQYVISSKKTTPTKQRGAVETKEVKRAREKRELQERLQDVNTRLASQGTKKKPGHAALSGPNGPAAAAAATGSASVRALGAPSQDNPMLAKLPERAALSDSDSSSSSDSDSDNGADSSSSSSSGSSSSETGSDSESSSDSSSSDSASSSDSDSDAAASPSKKRPAKVPPPIAQRKVSPPPPAAVRPKVSPPLPVAARPKVSPPLARRKKKVSPPLQIAALLKASSPATVTTGSLASATASPPVIPSKIVRSAHVPTWSAPGSAVAPPATTGFKPRPASRSISPALGAKNSPAANNSAANNSAASSRGSSRPVSPALPAIGVKTPLSRTGSATGLKTADNGTKVDWTKCVAKHTSKTATNKPADNSTASAASLKSFEELKKKKREHDQQKEKERKEHEEGVKRAADEKQRAEKKRADEERKRRLDCESSAMKLLDRDADIKRKEEARREQSMLEIQRKRAEAMRERQNMQSQLVDLNEQSDQMHDFEARYVLN